MQLIVLREHATIGPVQDGSESGRYSELHAHGHLEELGYRLTVSARDAEGVLGDFAQHESTFIHSVHHVIVPPNRIAEHMVIAL